MSVHNLLDGEVLYRREMLYAARVRAAGRSSNFITIPVPRYGHCNFEPNEVLAALVLTMIRGGVTPSLVEFLKSR